MQKQACVDKDLCICDLLLSDKLDNFFVFSNYQFLAVDFKASVSSYLCKLFQSSEKITHQ